MPVYLDTAVFTAPAVASLPDATKIAYLGLTFLADKAGYVKDDGQIARRIWPQEGNVEQGQLHEHLRRLQMAQVTCLYKVMDNAYIHLARVGMQNKSTSTRMPECTKCFSGTLPLFEAVAPSKAAKRSARSEATRYGTNAVIAQWLQGRKNTTTHVPSTLARLGRSIKEQINVGTDPEVCLAALNEWDSRGLGVGSFPRILEDHIRRINGTNLEARPRTWDLVAGLRD